jgi:hypothetical protein
VKTGALGRRWAVLGWVVLVGAGAALAAEVYKWVDEKGVTQYSALPPPGVKAARVDTGAPLPVHDCMGCVLQVDGQAWGLLTLDALEPGRFAGAAPLEALQAFSNLAAATVATAARLRQRFTWSLWRLVQRVDFSQRAPYGGGCSWPRPKLLPIHHPTGLATPAQG